MLDAWMTTTPHERFLHEIHERQELGLLPTFPPEPGSLCNAPSRAELAARRRTAREKGWSAPMAKGSALPSYRGAEDNNVHVDYRARFARRVASLERREAMRVRDSQLAGVRKTDALKARAKRDYDERRLLEEEASAEARAAGEATTSQFGAPPRVVKLGEWLYSAGLRKQIVAQEESDIHVMAS